MKYSELKLDLNLSLELRDKFVEGDERAYATIYKLYAKEMYAFGLSLCGNRELIEDAIHDVFIEIYARKEILKKVNNFNLYFLISFRNKLFYLINKSKKYTDFEIEKFDNFQEKNYEEIWIDIENENEKIKTVESIFECLNPNQKEVIYHRFIAGLSCEDISKIMGINYQSVKNLIYRSINKIKSIKTTLILVCMLNVIC